MESLEAASSISTSFDYMQIADDEWQQEEQVRKKHFAGIKSINAKHQGNLKKCIRGGIPTDQRANVWLIVSGGQQLLNECKDGWEIAVQVMKRAPLGDEIPFVHSPGSTPQYTSNNELENQLKFFLQVLWCQNRAINYAPLIPSVSIMLLMYLPQNKAYSTIQAMINRSREDSWYFALNRELFNIEINAVANLANEICPKVMKCADDLKISHYHIFLIMYTMFFFPYTEPTISLTFMDSYVNEGRKVLIRLSLALLIQEESKLVSSISSQDFFNIIFDTFKDMKSPHAANNLLKKAFSIQLSRSRNIIPLEIKCRKSHKLIESIPLPAELARQKYEFGMRFYHNNDSSYNISVRMSPTRKGDLLTENLYNKLYNYIPKKDRYPDLVFKMTEDGSSISYLLRASNTKAKYLFFVKTAKCVIGAFITSGCLANVVEDKRVFKGSHDMFIFNTNPFQIYHQQKYVNDNYISVDHEGLILGGPKAAIYIDSTMNILFSGECSTYGSPSFASEHGEMILDVELYKI